MAQTSSDIFGQLTVNLEVHLLTISQLRQRCEKFYFLQFCEEIPR